MPTEIELKYVLNDDFARELLTRRRLGDFVLGPFHVEIVTDVYYDTPDARVAKAGYALRYRRKNGNASLQLKSLTPASGAFHRRQELHIPTDSPTDSTHWPDTPEARQLRSLVGDHPLRPLFTIHQKRHEAQIMDEEGSPFALLSLDQVQWQAGEREKRGWEFEIELLPDKDEKLLQALADFLQRTPELHPQAISKYERGMALLGE